MDRLDAMKLFVASVDEGSLAAAGRRHGRSAASVTRAIALLESIAGEALLLRSTRRLHLTSAGERHVAVWRDVLLRLGDIAPAPSEGPMRGSFVLTAPELFGRLKVMPVLEAFLRREPSTSARVLLVNRLVDLVGEGVDMAVRLAPLPDSTMSATKLGDVRTLVCASPDYIARCGIPATPQDLGRFDCIGLNVEGDGELWSFGSEAERARVRSIRVRTRLSLNNAGAGIDAAVRGLGLVRTRGYQVAEDLATGRLVTVLTAFEPPPQPAHLVFHPDRGSRGVVRAFIDHAVPALRDEFRRITAMLDAIGDPAPPKSDHLPAE